MSRFGVARERHGDHHALAHAAGHLVRIVLDALLGRRDAHEAQHVDGPRDRGLVVELHVRLDALDELVPMVKTGFSEVIGSWKIIEMSFPRTSRMSLGESASRSFPL